MTGGYGWLKMHRKALENPVVMRDVEHLGLWTYVLLRAASEPVDVMFKGARKTLLPGQFTTGIRRISSELNMSESKVQRILKRFESDTQIEQEMSADCRLITVKNWDSYQKRDTRSETLVKRSRNASETQVKTNKEYKNLRREEYKNPIGEGEGATPRQEAVAFFQDPDAQEALVQAMASKTGAPEEFLRSEVGKFVGYWTERTPDGKREKWQTMDTFEVKRRLATWLSRATKYPAKKTYAQPPIV